MALREYNKWLSSILVVLAPVLKLLFDLAAHLNMKIFCHSEITIIEQNVEI